MISFLLKAIPHLLSLPVAIVALGGVFFALFAPKKKDELFWIIFVSIIFVIGWRLACHFVLFSSRYSSILLYPGLILAAYFCSRLKEVCLYNKVSRKHPEYRKIGSFVPYLFLFGLCLASMIKSFQFDPKFRGIISVCQAYREDVNGKEPVFTYYINGSEKNRIHHYAQLANYYEPIKLCKDETDYDQIIEAIRDKRNIAGTHYFFYIKKHKDKEIEPTADILDGGTWREVCRYDISSTNKTDFILYSYSPYCNNIEVWEKEIPRISPTNLCPNGDFEQILSEEELETRIAYYKKIEASPFFCAPEKPFPKDWWLNVLKALDGKSPFMSLTEEQPLAGKYSLEMYGRGCWGDMTYDIVSVNSAFVVKRNYLVSGFMRALEDSEVWISPRYRDMDSGNNPPFDSFFFILSAGKTYRFSFPIQKQMIPKEHNLVLISINAKGHLLVDNVEFLYRREEKKESSPEAIPIVSPEEAEKLNTEALNHTGLHG